MITLSISKQKSELRIYVHYRLFSGLSRWIGDFTSFDDVRRINKMKEDEQRNLTIMPRPLM